MCTISIHRRTLHLLVSSNLPNRLALEPFIVLEDPEVPLTTFGRKVSVRYIQVVYDVSPLIADFDQFCELVLTIV